MALTLCVGYFWNSENSHAQNALPALSTDSYYTNYSKVEIYNIIKQTSNHCSHKFLGDIQLFYFHSGSPAVGDINDFYGLQYWAAKEAWCKNTTFSPLPRSALTATDTHILNKNVTKNVPFIDALTESSCPHMQQLAAAHEAAQSYYGAIFWNYKAYTLCKDEALLQKVHRLHEAAGLTYNKDLLDSFIDVQVKKPG